MPKTEFKLHNFSLNLFDHVQAETASGDHEPLLHTAWSDALHKKKKGVLKYRNDCNWSILHTVCSNFKMLYESVYTCEVKFFIYKFNSFDI